MTISLSEEQRVKLMNSDDVYSVMQNILLREEKIDQDKEHFWMIGMAGNNRILYIELVSLGSVNATTVEPMNVFRVAVMKNATKVIMVHNHPTGELKPSKKDKDITDRLMQVGRILNIQVIDHLVISTRSYMSFADTGLLAELELSTKWVPQFELIERIRAEEKRIRDEEIKLERKKAKEEKEKAEKKGKKEGEYKKAFEIAKEMLQVNEPIEKITKYTGLTREEIEGL
ncbi:MAG: JAB domain-containing protein [Bacteroidales bacterium]|nr:JAB domain-containing protein [Bacteroidales bacterium]